jgi:hypothetical protein
MSSGEPALCETYTVPQIVTLNDFNHLHVGTVAATTFLQPAAIPLSVTAVNTARSYVMSYQTKFQARKVQVPEQGEFEKVNWQYAADLDTMAVSISDKSGIVKVDLGLGRRNPALYRNEILAILDKGDELRQYLEDHPQAVDTPPSKKALAAAQAIVDTVNQAKTAQLNAMVKSMRDAKIPEAQIIEAVKSFKA